ncbi:MAG: hypothetical protein ABIT76_04305 [Chthoniobacterales bacterium]
MKEIYRQIESLRAQQRSAAGPHFNQLSTPQTWLELLRFAFRYPAGDFKTQMLEVAAFAISAIEAHEQMMADEENEESAVEWESILEGKTSVASLLGSIDHADSFIRLETKTRPRDESGPREC